MQRNAKPKCDFAELFRVALRKSRNLPGAGRAGTLRDNAKRSAGRGEKTVRWTVFSRGDPRRGVPRFAEQGEANKKAFSISNAEQKYPVSLPVSPPAPSPSRRERGFHPVTRPFTLRRTARPLPSRGGVCSQRCPTKSKFMRHFRCGACRFMTACVYSGKSCKSGSLRQKNRGMSRGDFAAQGKEKPYFKSRVKMHGLFLFQIIILTS